METVTGRERFPSGQTRLKDGDQLTPTLESRWIQPHLVQTASGVGFRVVFDPLRGRQPRSAETRRKMACDQTTPGKL